VVVAFDHRRHRVQPLHRVGIERPHAAAHRLVTRVDQVVAMVFVVGEVDLAHALAASRR